MYAMYGNVVRFVRAEKFPEGSVCSSFLSNNKRLFDMIGMIAK